MTTLPATDLGRAIFEAIVLERQKWAEDPQYPGRRRLAMLRAAACLIRGSDAIAEREYRELIPVHPEDLEGASEIRLRDLDELLHHSGLRWYGDGH